MCSSPPTLPAISVTRRSIAMWMSSSPRSNGNVPVAQFGTDSLERTAGSSRSEVADDPPRGEHGRVRERLADVELREPAIVGEIESFSARKASCWDHRIWTWRTIPARTGRPARRPVRRPPAVRGPERHRASAAATRATCVLGHLGEERQRDRPRRDVFAHGELALSMPEVSRGSSSSGAPPESTACSGCHSSPSARTTPSRSRPRGSCDDEHEPAALCAALSRAGQRQLLDIRERLAIAAPRPAHVRRASASSRSSCASPSAHARSERR